ncbi:MOXD1-like protein 1 [Frankliniella fusca]|uniref:MOXD1-like protein 1 n=1 Tax=Frankliniella fusca TaxID=407009 RepID=A0AAE1H4C2_9NEOP|nr:MOXD1-like protein 1 [Frankliniella fusca]
MFAELLLLVVPVVLAGVVHREPAWSHSTYLDGAGRVRLSWRPRERDVIFQLEAPSRGYLGLGFSGNGAMAGSDIVVAWVDDASGRAHLLDCHATSNAAPILDDQEDVKLMWGKQNGTHTCIRFRRAWDTCDHQDMVLGEDTIRVIWAMGERDPVIDDIVGVSGLEWHGAQNRGSHSLHLRGPPAVLEAHGTDVYSWDVRQEEFIVPDNMDTVYWCRIFKVPGLTKKHHMLGYEPIITPESVRHVHHMLLYECAPKSRQLPLLEKAASERGAACYSPAMPPEWDSCLTPIVAWAVGSEGEFFPDHVGIPLGEGHRSTYFMLEVHYDNPSLKRLRDNSGLKIYYTPNLRQHDAGILSTGIAVSPLHMIPPQQPDYKTFGYCPSQCSKKLLPAGGIKVISVVLHSHMAGSRMELRHLRDGKELPRIAQDKHYDFNYQQARRLPREVTVLPGDELVTECVYKTVNRSYPTYGGYSTKQEMCLSFALHYPRNPLSACHSMTPVEYFFSTLGVEQFYGVDMPAVERLFLKTGSPDNGASDEEKLRQLVKSFRTTTTPTPSVFDAPVGDEWDDEANQRAILALKAAKDFTIEGEGDPEGAGAGPGGLFADLVIKEPSQFRNRTFSEHLLALPWTEPDFTLRLEEVLSSHHMAFCRLMDDQLAVPADVFELKNTSAFIIETELSASQCQHELREDLEQQHLFSGAACRLVKDNSLVLLICLLVAAFFY